ncbi:adenylate kinase family enzyme [Deinococcus sp. HSC-46F16]|uniref:adenylate kinase n=1 Tax=Deinococcus sp. HSC-46F16 TaxID=2910968 RepID=UPI0020A189A9|nr:adenylate kinase [Deinococcus sp. HSC-46F16]MCP2013362.1 adenylate kinase family enzyme [Deinococcus sp. HSC-46F16]
MQRVIVIGTTGSGKTTLARALAARLGVPHGEQDAWNHLPGWQEAPREGFRAQVAAFTAGDTWVMDGNYSKARDLGWVRADTLVWLDYPGPVVFWRLLTRTVRRIARRQELWNGNREHLRNALKADSPLPWFFKTHWRRRRETPALLADYPHLRVVRLRTPGEAARWLAALSPEAVSGPPPRPA